MNRAVEAVDDAIVEVELLGTNPQLKNIVLMLAETKAYLEDYLNGGK